MTIDPSILIFTVINFIVLMFLLNTFLFKPLLDFMHKRDKKIEEGKAAEARARAAEAENKLRLAEELDRLHRENRLRIESADAEAKQSYAGLIGGAERDIELRREASLKKLDEDEARLKAELSAYIPAFVELLSKSFNAGIREDGNA